MIPKTWRGRLIALAVVVTVPLACAAVFVVPGLYAKWFGPRVVNNALVGQTESQVRSAYGEPVSDEVGYKRLGVAQPPSLPPGPIRTLIFHPRGLSHLEGGTLWVWFHQRGADWVCFKSCWFADGLAF